MLSIENINKKEIIDLLNKYWMTHDGDVINSIPDKTPAPLECVVWMGIYK